MPTSSTTLRTWSGAVSWTPQQVLRPISQEAVVAAVRAARARGCALRVIGGGHSFSALAATDGITLSLDGYQGLDTADPGTGLVTLRGGTRLWAVAEMLAPRSEQVLRPISQEAVVAAVRAARARGCALRGIGGGHSFSALAATDGITLSLDGYQGLVTADPGTGLVTLRGGTRLWAVAELLAPYGLALSVMGDIDRQSIAGAIQTGTHGTGGAFTGFAGMVRGLRLVLADG